MAKCGVFFDIPRYMLPPPNDVLAQLHNRYDLLWQHSQITLLEIGLGLFLGLSLGLISALLLSASDYLSKLLLPLLVISQAIPVFAIAPLLVLWFGYGLASKIVMTILIIYFPVTAACYDGLRNTSMQWLELAKPCRFQQAQCYLKCAFPPRYLPLLLAYVLPFLWHRLARLSANGWGLHKD